MSSTYRPGTLALHAGQVPRSGDRLAEEWRRDRDLGRGDVDPPANFDAAAPATTWRAHRESLFDGFLGRAARS